MVLEGHVCGLKHRSMEEAVVVFDAVVMVLNRAFAHVAYTFGFVEWRSPSSLSQEKKKTRCESKVNARKAQKGSAVYKLAAVV